MKKSIYRVYASVYRVPEQETLKANLILIVNDKGKLVEDVPGPATIGPYFGRFSKKNARMVVQSYLEDIVKMRVDPEDIEFMPYKKLDKMLFKLENK